MSRRDGLRASERLRRARRLGTTVARTYLGVRAQRLVARHLAPRDMPRRWSIEQRLAHHDVPGIAVAIIEDGAVVWAKGYGVKRIGRDDPVDADTVFSAGSVSKMINAALVLRMVAAGELELDTDVNRYLKRWKVADNPHTRSAPVTPTVRAFERE